MTGLVAIIPKNTLEKIRIELEQYKKQNLVSIRVYYNSGDADWRPTKKGVSIQVKKLDDVIAGLQKAREKAQKDGWL